MDRESDRESWVIVMYYIEKELCLRGNKRNNLFLIDEE